MRDKKVSEVGLVNFIEISDQRGKLVSLESNKNIPFNIKRVYYLFETSPGAERGFHAHIDLQQMAICVSGSCFIDVEYAGGKKSFLLDNPNQGLYMAGVVWREIRAFSDNCVLMVAADALYSEDDYIRDYNSFEKHLNTMYIRLPSDN